MPLPPTSGATSVRVRAVLLPGSGSDADFLERAFGPALAANNLEIRAVPPHPHAVVAGYLAALDVEGAVPGPLVVGGISLGALVAARWALEHQQRLDGLLVALPPWLGIPYAAPAALSARHSAEQLRHKGLPAVLHDVRHSSPTWLSDELSRAWPVQWPDLPQALDEAAIQPGPTAAELRRLQIPTGIVGAVDDAVHPVSVARAWAAAGPNAHLATIDLAALGANPAVLGTACVDAWRCAAAGQPSG